jgi:pyruvate formate-lyase activating enzyme-like uncharacterized protein
MQVKEKIEKHNEHLQEALLIEAHKIFQDDFSFTRWIEHDEIIKLTKERDLLLEELSPYLSNDSHDASGTKPHLGDISPGCKICQHGGWDCSWINFRCTRNCAFCDSDTDTRICTDKEPYCLAGEYVDPRDHADYINLLGYTGVGLSGGEPLLRFDLVLEHIKAIRRYCNPSIYIWLYSNGDLLNEFILKELHKAGLNEIRFDIAATNYDTTSVSLAKKYIHTVTVEIPCIPDDLDLLKNAFIDLHKIKVDYINLHQLHIGRNNYKPYLKHRLLKNSWHSPVLESEMNVLKLMKYVVDQKLNLQVNYCSKIYKDTFQERNRRRTYYRLQPSALESLTENGYIRRAFLACGNIEQIADELEKLSIPRARWKLLENKEAIAIHSDELDKLEFVSDMKLKVEYFSIDLHKSNESERFTYENFNIQKFLVHNGPWLEPQRGQNWIDAFVRNKFNYKSDIEDIEIKAMWYFEKMIKGLPPVY